MSPVKRIEAKKANCFAAETLVRPKYGDRPRPKYSDRLIKNVPRDLGVVRSPVGHLNINFDHVGKELYLGILCREESRWLSENKFRNVGKEKNFSATLGNGRNGSGPQR